MSDSSGSAIQVEVVEMWDGLSLDTGYIATLRLYFPDFPGGEHEADKHEDLLAPIYINPEITPALEEILERHFPKHLVSLNLYGTRIGSLELFLAVACPVGAVYAFFKDYNDVREGVIQFVQDVTTAGSQLKGLALKGYVKARDAVKKERGPKNERRKRRRSGGVELNCDSRDHI